MGLLEVLVAGRRLAYEEREEIAWRRDRGEGIREIARVPGRAPSTISRELKRDISPSPRRYRAFPARIMARERARRGKPRKLVRGSPLRAEVARMVRLDCSPGQIAGRLGLEHPGGKSMLVSRETICQALLVRGKGSLRAGVAAALRSGRARRRRPRMGSRAGRAGIAGMVSVSERPAEAGGRAVPGHREGDLIIGMNGKSQVAALAERASRFCVLIALPDGRAAGVVAGAPADRITALPDALKRTLTRDRGIEMAGHARFGIATGVPVCFAGPPSPWQRGTSENTSGLVRCCLPRGTGLSGWTRDQLDAIAGKLSTRPRRTLGYRTPAEALGALIAA